MGEADTTEQGKAWLSAGALMPLTSMAITIISITMWMDSYNMEIQYNA